MLERWRSAAAPSDGRFPEEWVASVVKARNPGREDEVHEGLTFREDQPDQALRNYIEANPEEALGAAHAAKYGAHPGLLVKLLDAAERLAIQVHPDKPTAEKLFQSAYGKTEAWYFLGGRNIAGEDPYVLCGFKPGMTREKWERLFHAQDIEGMIQSLHKVYPKPGDIMLIRGGIPHAIGPGNWMVEIQEPTDFTIRTERATPSGLALTDQAIHQGLGYERMFDCFHYDTYTEEEMLRLCKLTASVAERGQGWQIKQLISYNDTPYFSMDQLELENGAIGPAWTANGRFAVMIVLGGSGYVHWGDRKKKVEQGDQLFIPAELPAVVFASEDGPLQIVRCLPPALS
ncbi:mannose-6-phosphate isomerase [Xylanibacillus composti]|uniref:Mannose-6-phosphate isomerase n=2 Tax=Xylanibacillus composti TaxID=1572762 RepID=A0A8J4GYH2_9BACL|nr:mannose-6-phosphate isomerase [Xylanibacillus composti]GIQ67528.1 mannose-6-phosphate isomerase [Xylanibacillus composti]